MRLKRLQSELERVAVFDAPRIEWEQYPTPPHLAAQILQLMHRYGDVDGKAVGDLGVGCGILTIAAALMGSSYNVAYDIDEGATAIARRNFAVFDCEVDIVHVDVASMRSRRADDDGEGDEEEQMKDDSATRRTKATRAPTAPSGRKSRGRGRGRGRSHRPPRPKAAAQRSASENSDDDDTADSDEEDPLRPLPSTASPLQTASPSSPPPPCSLPSSSFLPPPCVLDTVVLNPPFGTRQSGIDVTFLHVALQLSHGAVYSLHKTSTRDFFHRLCERWGVKGEVVAEMQFQLKRSYAFHKEKSKDVEVDLWRFTFHAEQGRPERFGRAHHRHTTTQ